MLVPLPALILEHEVPQLFHLGLLVLAGEVDSEGSDRASGGRWLGETERWVEDRSCFGWGGRVGGEVRARGVECTREVFGRRQVGEAVCCGFADAG